MAELILECFPKRLWLLGFCFKTVLLNKQHIESEILHVNSLNKPFFLLVSTGLILNSKFGLYGKAEQLQNNSCLVLFFGLLKKQRICKKVQQNTDKNTKIF